MTKHLISLPAQLFEFLIGLNSVRYQDVNSTLFEPDSYPGVEIHNVKHYNELRNKRI